jgi:hypothetical protein
VGQNTANISCAGRAGITLETNSGNWVNSAASSGADSPGPSVARVPTLGSRLTQRRSREGKAIYFRLTLKDLPPVSTCHQFGSPVTDECEAGTRSSPLKLSKLATKSATVGVLSMAPSVLPHFGQKARLEKSDDL